MVLFVLQRRNYLTVDGTYLFMAKFKRNTSTDPTYAAALYVIQRDKSWWRRGGQVGWKRIMKSSSRSDDR